MTNILLSICIPTYNRSSYLRELLFSIGQQVVGRSDVEICISDNASDDDTSRTVEEFKNQFDVKTALSINHTNLGADANFLKAVGLASGKYCWIIGSDDAILPGSISSIIKQLGKDPDIYVFNRLFCDIELSPLFIQQWLNEQAGDWYDLTDRESYLAYCSKACSIGALFSYLSTVIFRRDKWAEVKGEECFVGSGYVHVFKILSFSLYAGLLLYSSKCYVMCRGQNDSFTVPRDGSIYDNSFVQRLLLDLDGYSMLAFSLYPGDEIRRNALLGLLRRERPIYPHILKLRIHDDPHNWSNYRNQAQGVLLSQSNYLSSWHPAASACHYVFSCINALSFERPCD